MSYKIPIEHGFVVVTPNVETLRWILSQGILEVLSLDLKSLFQTLFFFTYSCLFSTSGNFPKRTPTCRCMWRWRAKRRSVWVAPMKNCCGVCRRASWVHTWPPAHPPSTAQSLDQAPLPVHIPITSDCLHQKSYFISVLFNLGGGNPLF